MTKIIKSAKGTYTTADITVDGSGRVISAASGSGGAAGNLVGTFGSVGPSSGNYTASPGANFIVAYVAGGGGGGGRSPGSVNGGAGGGGPGGSAGAQGTVNGSTKDLTNVGDSSKGNIMNQSLRKQMGFSHMSTSPSNFNAVNGNISLSQGGPVANIGSEGGEDGGFGRWWSVQSILYSRGA